MKIPIQDKITSPRIYMILKVALLLFASILITNCSSKQSDFVKLKSENDSLVQRLEKKELELNIYRQTNVRIKNSEIYELPSKYTKETYDIYISYPNNYEKSGKKYPVLVVLDAEVNFGAIDYISKRLIKDGLIPELFIVGIA